MMENLFKNGDSYAIHISQEDCKQQELMNLPI